MRMWGWITCGRGISVLTPDAFSLATPSTESIAAPTSLHPYLYANQSPTNYSDKSGAMTLTETIVTTEVISVLAESSINAISSLSSEFGGTGPIQWKSVLFSGTVEAETSLLFAALLIARSEGVNGRALESSWALIGAGEGVTKKSDDEPSLGFDVDIASFIDFAESEAKNLSNAIDGPFNLPDVTVEFPGLTLQSSHYDLTSPRWLGLQPWVFSGAFLLAQAGAKAAEFGIGVSVLQVGLGSGAALEDRQETQVSVERLRHRRNFNRRRRPAMDQLR